MRSLAVLCVTLALASAPIAAQPDGVLEFDWPAFAIGVAEYEEGPTGTTIFHFPKPVSAVVDVRGGAPGTLNTDALRLGYDSPFVDAIVFAGGSSYGLSAATGVANALKARLRDPGDWGSIATVLGAIIFDLGPRRFNALTPDDALGRRALEAAVPGRFPLGARGAGRFAMQGGFYGARQHSGQGGAYRETGADRIAVFTVVNAYGHVVDRAGKVPRCARTPAPCPELSTLLRDAGALPASAAPPGPGSNTTVTLVIVNRKLDYWALQRLAAQVHTAMARAIVPFATERDGDVLFAVSTNEIDDEARTPAQLAAIASEVAVDAVLASVPALDPVPTLIEAPDPATARACVGRYRFAPGIEGRVFERDGAWWIEGPDRDSEYLPRAAAARLLAAEGGDFIVDHGRRAVLRCEHGSDGAVSGITLQPGRWPVRGVRVAR